MEVKEVLVRYLDPLPRLRRNTSLLWDPFPFGAVSRMLRDTLDEMERAFSGDRVGYGPEVEYEDGVARIEIEAPGLDAGKDINVELRGRVLTVSGGREETEDNGKARARRRSQFSYSWALDEDVDPDSIRARYEAGILTVEVPVGRREDSTARRIPISTSESRSVEAAGSGDSSNDSKSS